MSTMPHWPIYTGPNRDSTALSERVMLMLNACQDPHKNLKGVIHITGTNGKGSTANFIYNILRQHQFNVNLYTSPHIYEYTERVVMNGSRISQEKSYFYTEKLRLICSDLKIEPTLFEAMTVVCFMAFSETGADFNVIEVGMGGQNDATNVFEQSVAVFSPIHVDHVKFMGSTPTENALEKLGIVKPRSTIVSGPQPEEVLSLISGLPNNTYMFNKDYFVFQAEEDPSRFVFEHGGEVMMLDRPSLIGDHQLINVGVAIMSTIATNISIVPDAINKAITSTYWPARMEPVLATNLLEVLPKNSKVFIDGAHNVSGAFVVANFLKQHQTTHKLYVINGRTKNTDSLGFLAQFVDIVDKVFAIRVRLEALPEAPEIIVDEGKKLNLDIEKAGGIVDAMQKVSLHCQQTPACVIICGSLYLARDLRAAIGAP